MEQIFYIAKRKRKSDLHHHGEAYNLGWCLEITKGIGIFHPQTLRECCNIVKIDFNLTVPETDLLAPLRDSTILAYQKTDAIGERKWRRKNPWVPTIDSVPGISRENTEFFRKHLQNLYDDTLWKKEKSIKKNYRGKLYKNGVYFTLKIDKNGLNTSSRRIGRCQIFLCGKARHAVCSVNNRLRYQKLFFWFLFCWLFSQFIGNTRHTVTNANAKFIPYFF